MQSRVFLGVLVCWSVLAACQSSSPCDGVVCEAGEMCGIDDGLCRCDESMCSEGEVCGETGCEVPLPEPSCVPDATGFTPGSSSFREVTDAWGLTGIVGVRLSVADLDSDGAPDLVVRRGGAAFDDFGPEGVRRTWLLRNARADGSVTFQDTTLASGLLQTRQDLGENVGRPMDVLAFGDVDNDGHLDAYLGMPSSDRDFTQGEHSEILLGRGDGTFELGPVSDVRSPEYIEAPAGASFVDFDRDGSLDLWVPQHNFSTSSGSVVFLHDRLYRGDGAGGFVDETETRGVMTAEWSDLMDLDAGRAHSRAWGSLARDLDGDGTPELLAPSYGRAPNLFWRGQRADDGSVSWVNESVRSGYAFDGDRSWQDNEFARCFCTSSPTAEGCEGVGSPRVRCSPNWNHDQDRNDFRLGGNSGATAAGDVDGDGDLDLFTGEIKHWWAGEGADGGELLINEGDGVFSRPGDEVTGLAVEHVGSSWDEGHMTNTLFDFDNDGRLDVYIGGSDYAGNRGHLFHQVPSDEGVRFVEVETADFFEHNRSHGVVVADFDGDGDLDIIVGHSRSRCDAAAANNCYETSQIRAFENTTPPAGFIQVSLVGGEGTNRGAIGAQVTVQTETRRQLQELDGGHGHYGSQSDSALHFGVGAACSAEVEVRWPNAELTLETFTLPVGHHYEITQGGDVRVL